MTERRDSNPNTLRQSKNIVSMALVAMLASGCLADDNEKPTLHTDRAKTTASADVVNPDDVKHDDINMRRVRKVIGLKAGDYLGKETELVTYTLRDGVLTSRTQADKVEEFLPDIEGPLVDNDAFLKAAEADGTLGGVRYTIDRRAGQGGYMAYSPGIDTEHSLIEYRFPPNGSVSSEMMSVMIRHEAVHALVQGLDIAAKHEAEIRYDQSIAVDTEVYETNCNVLRDATINEVLHSHGDEILTNLAALERALPQYSDTIREMSASIEDGTYTTFLQAYETDIAANNKDSLPGCSSFAPDQLLFTLFDAKEVKRYMYTGTAVAEHMSNIAMVWGQGLVDSTSMDVLTESKYLGAEHIPGADRMGHPYDNANELVASLITVATSYPKEFRHNLSVSPDATRQAVLSLLELAVNDIVRTHPDSKDLETILRRAVKNATS